MPWIQHRDYGYTACSHMGCSKKALESITDHDCCGLGDHGWNHRLEAQASYDGPGAFFHGYWEAALYPGVCATCGEAQDSH